MMDEREAELLDFIIGKMMENRKSYPRDMYTYDFITHLFLRKDEIPTKFQHVSIGEAEAKYLFRLIYEQHHKKEPIIQQTGFGEKAGFIGDLNYNIDDFVRAGGFKRLFVGHNPVISRRTERNELSLANHPILARLFKWRLFLFWNFIFLWILL